MTQCGGSWSWPYRLTAALWIGGAIIAASGNCTLAQIKPDTTLGAEGSVVKSLDNIGVPVDQIDGGAKRGANLFHSFQEFNIKEERGAYFTNPVGIKNILSRVTGKNRSDIQGTLGVLGKANLFLINPNGIVFGSNASLNVEGSFVATTANAVQFDNQGFFNTSEPTSPPLLTVNPSAFLFNQIAHGSIENNSIAPAGKDPTGAFSLLGLRVPDGQSLLLLGGDITVNSGGLNAFGGRVELGGVTGAGTVGLKGNGNNLSLSFPKSVERSDVSLTSRAVVAVAPGNGGSIAVNARNLTMKESFLYAGIGPGLGSDNSKAGNIKVNATRTINLNNSLISNQVQAAANGLGGDVNISASKLLVKDGAQVSTSTSGKGKGGNLTVNAQDMQLIGASAEGQSPSGLGAYTEPNSTGDAGDLTLNTDTLLVKDGAQVFTGTSGKGKGGDLTVNAQDVQLIRKSAEGLSFSGLDARAGSNGDAGDLTINTNTLLVKDGAQVFTGTFGKGKGGNLTIDAQDVQVIGTSANGRLPSGLFASAEPDSTGDAGDLTINTNTLLVKDRAGVAVESLATGTAGTLGLNARSIRLDGNATLTANTRSTKIDPNSEQATISISSQGLIMSGTSNIFTNAIGENVIGGNINIDTDVLAALENSDISANAEEASGGRVIINAQGIFGIEFRDQLTPQSDITATSELGPEFSGTVELNTPDVDPSQGLVALPEEVVDVSGLIAQTCPAGSGPRQSKFVVTGRGGLPPNPGETLNTDAVQVDLVTLNPKLENRSSPAISTNPTSSSASPIVEAQGWVKNSKGQIVLTAQAPTVTPHSPGLAPASCPGS